MLLNRVQVCDTVVAAWLDRFSRNFDDGVRIPAEPTDLTPLALAYR